MSVQSKTLTIDFESDRAETVHRALSSRQRVKILSLLARDAMNVNDIAGALGISQSTASAHVQMLEKSGLIEVQYGAGDRGAEKRCWVTFNKIVFETDFGSGATGEGVSEASMPVGLFTAISAVEPCGMADSVEGLGVNDIQSLLIAERARAQLLWFAQGWVEYTFPCHLPDDAIVSRVEFVAEVCSEASNYNNDWPSDIEVQINGRSIGAWTSPGDFGGSRGRLNPAWWSDSYTQYGILKTWSVDDSGSRIDGQPADSTCLADLGINSHNPIVVRVGNPEDAVNRGGVNLFGQHFGNHPQDLLIRIHYKRQSSTDNK